MKAMSKTPGKNTARAKASQKRGGKAGGELLPPDWRKRLPQPVEYYTAKLGRLGRMDAKGWVNPRSPWGGVLYVNLKTGDWVARDCKYTRGDMVRFHHLLTGLDPLQAIWALLKWRR